MTLYADDAVIALHGQPAMFGKEAVRDFFAPRLGKADAQFEIEHEVVKTSGDVGYAISKYWLRIENPQSGFVYKDAGRSLLVYELRDGRWLIAADVDQATPDVSWPSPGGLE